MKLLLQVIGAIGVTEVLHEVLAHADIPLNKLIEKIEKFKEKLEMLKFELNKLADESRELEKYRQKMLKAGRTGLTAEDRKELTAFIDKYEKDRQLASAVTLKYDPRDQHCRRPGGGNRRRGPGVKAVTRRKPKPPSRLPTSSTRVQGHT